MKIVNLNPAPDIGASSWLVELEGHRILLDAGTHPKRDGRESLPLYRLIEREEVDAVAVSHCHHDHVGSLPVALRHFPRAHVLMPELSYFLVERVLHNSVNVMARQRDELGIREYPLYSHDELDAIAPRFQGFRYNREVEWAAYHKTRAGIASPTIELFDAGHVLGSAGIRVCGRKDSLFYTGDVSFRDQTLLRGARFEDSAARVLLVETTRGARPTPPGFSREAEADRLAESIQRVLKRKGSVLIPTFALGRTQEMLALLALLMRSGRLRKQAIYVGGLGRVFTEIYDLEAHRTHRQHQNLILHETLDLQVLEPSRIARMKHTGGRIFVMTAGMMTEHTAAHDLGMQFVGDERQAVFFVGYTDPDTPGGRLKAAKQGDTFLFSQQAGELTRKCEIAEFDFTAHANREDTLEFIGAMSPEVVVLGHGEDDARRWFREAVQERHPRLKIAEPGPGETIEV